MWLAGGCIGMPGFSGGLSLDDIVDYQLRAYMDVQRSKARLRGIIRSASYNATHSSGVSGSPLQERQLPQTVEVLRIAMTNVPTTTSTSDLSIPALSHVALSRAELACGICLKGKQHHSSGNTSTCAWKKPQPYRPERRGALPVEPRGGTHTSPYCNTGRWLQQDASHFPIL